MSCVCFFGNQVGIDEESGAWFSALLLHKKGEELQHIALLISWPVNLTPPKGLIRPY